MKMRGSGKLWMIKTRVSFSHDQMGDNKGISEKKKINK